MKKPSNGRRHSISSKSRKVFAADFEATTEEDDCRVWLWGIADIEYPEDVRKGYDIDEFLRVAALSNSVMYFHNLKYDGHFIIDRLLKTGYAHKVGKQGLEPGQFRTLISDMNKFYSINVRWKNGKTMEFRDSLKKIPLTLAGVAKAFKLPESKGELDYKKHRPLGYRPTDEEIEYLKTDVSILARAIKVVLENGMKKLTVGADALAEYKSLTGKKFDRAFPVLSEEMDAEIRRAYRGGFTYADPRFSGRKLTQKGGGR